MRIWKKKEYVSTPIDADIYDFFREMAGATNESVARVINEALRQWIDRYDNDNQRNDNQTPFPRK